MSRSRPHKSAPRRAAPHRAGRGSWWALPLFLAAVFAVKSIVLLQLQNHPLLQPEGALDSAEYVRLAREVLGGNVLLGPGLYYVSPLYLYFLSAALAVVDSYTFVRVVQIALGTAAVACTFITARAWFCSRAGWMAAVLAAGCGVFTFYEIVLFQSSLDAFLTSAALACLSTTICASGLKQARGFRLQAEDPATRMLLLAGLLFGLQILNRPNIVIAVAGLAIALAIARQARAAGWLAAGVVVALAPIVARNGLVAHQFALASSQGGLNFYIGNNDQATGQYVAVPGVRANIAGQAEDTRRVAEAAAGRTLSDAQVSSYFASQAGAWIRDHPGRAAALFARKLALAFNARHQWLDFSYPYYAYDTGSALRFLVIGPWLLVPLGLCGLFAGLASASNRAAYVSIAAFVPLYAISVAIFFVAERYRLPLLIALTVYAGRGLDVIVQAVRTRSWNVAGVSATAALVIGIVLAAWPFAISNGRFEERLRLSKALLNRGDREGAADELERAYALRPDDAVTEFNLGMALVGLGRSSEGLPHVRHAVDAGVPIPGARYALASATFAGGDRDGAAALLRSYSPEPGESADSCYQVAILALRAGAPDVASRYLRRALELRPGWPAARAALDSIAR